MPFYGLFYRRICFPQSVLPHSGTRLRQLLLSIPDRTHAVDISGTVVSESSDCLLLSGTDNDNDNVNDLFYQIYTCEVVYIFKGWCSLSNSYMIFT